MLHRGIVSFHLAAFVYVSDQRCAHRFRALDQHKLLVVTIVVVANQLIVGTSPVLVEAPRARRSLH